MAVEISYREATNNFGSILDRVVDDCEVVMINRPGRKNVALISTEELARIVEAVGLSQKYAPSAKSRIVRHAGKYSK